MTTLRMNGVRCASLEDFRKNFDFTNAKDYLRQGRLSCWVRDLGENELADELDELKVADYSDKTLLDNLIGIFTLPIEPPVSESVVPAEPDEPNEPDSNSKPEYSQKVNDIREKLENPDFSGTISAPRDPLLIAELLNLLHEYFDQWSAALRKARGQATSSNRWELNLTTLAGYLPFMRCSELLGRRISAFQESEDIQHLFDLPRWISWTTVSHPEQLEKSKAIAAYYVSFVEFDYRLNRRKSSGNPKAAPTKKAVAKKAAPVKKAAPCRKAAPAKKVVVKKAAAPVKKAAPCRKAAPAKKAPAKKAAPV